MFVKTVSQKRPRRTFKNGKNRWKLRQIEQRKHSSMIESFLNSIFPNSSHRLCLLESIRAFWCIICGTLWMFHFELFAPGVGTQHLWWRCYGILKNFTRCYGIPASFERCYGMRWDAMGCYENQHPIASHSIFQNPLRFFFDINANIEFFFAKHLVKVRKHFSTPISNKKKFVKCSNVELTI